jgi:hypothetical protein
MATEPNYDINYEDERFKQVEAEKNAALSNVQNTYDNMINQSDSFYQEQQAAVDKWKDTQSQLQQEQTDFAIEQIEQQKEQTEKEYKKEQSGAYTDWQKESNKYGANAEAMASAGLMGTGYSESSQVAMYNTYQNRVATAKASIEQAQIALNNEITAARLANNAAQAEIALQAYQQKVELALQGFQYKNELLSTKLNQELIVKQMYDNEWQNVLAQMNQENALAEQVRQYNESLKEEQRQYNESLKEEQRQFDKSYDYKTIESDYKALLKALEKSGVTVNENGDVVVPKIEKEEKPTEPVVNDVSTKPQKNFAYNSKADVAKKTASGTVDVFDVMTTVAKNNMSKNKAADYLADLVNDGKLSQEQAVKYYKQIAATKGW